MLLRTRIPVSAYAIFPFRDKRCQATDSFDPPATREIDQPRGIIAEPSKIYVQIKRPLFLMFRPFRMTANATRGHFVHKPFWYR